MTTARLDAAQATRPSVRLLAAVFVSSFDRFVISPMLILIATTLNTQVSATAGLAGGYFLAYGLSQPIWGVLSDRFGRLVVMRATLLGAAIAGVASTLAPNLTILMCARVVCGACFGAVIPTALTYVGDTVDTSRRQRALSDVMAATAIGTALATSLAGFATHMVGWRAVFAIPAVSALLCATALRTLCEPTRTTSGSARSQMRVVLRNRWARVVFVLAFVEGAILLGIMTFLAVALQTRGATAAIAGVTTAAYGVSVIAFSRLIKSLTRKLPVWALITIGGIQMCGGYALVATRIDPVAVTLTAVLLGGGWAFMHSSLQTWATEVAPQARGTAVSLFAAALFLGSAAATAAAAPAAQHDHYTLLFASAATAAIPLTLSAAVGWRRWAAHSAVKKT